MGLEKAPESVKPKIIKDYVALPNDGLGHLGDALSIKLSSLGEDIMVRDGRRYSLAHDGKDYVLLANGKEVKRLKEQDLFLDTYDFAGFSFTLRKLGPNYEVYDKNGGKSRYLIASQNLDSFMREFAKVGGTILTEAHSKLARRELAHEVEYRGTRKDFPNLHQINSTVGWDIIATDVDLDKIGPLVIPRVRSREDGKALIQFFLDHLNIKKDTRS